MLKPQDTLIALKYWSVRRSGTPLGLRDLAQSLGISAGEVSKGVKRCIAAKLMVEREGAFYSETGGLLEWLSYGVRFALPKQEAGFGRGMATAWNCPLVKTELVPPNPGYVWLVAGGESEGVILEPIHASAPLAASCDDLLYQALALVEVIRIGKPRELQIARDGLKRLIVG